MNLVHLGSDYGGWTIDLDSMPADGVVLDCGVGRDITFAEALHEVRPQLRFVLVDHTADSAEFVAAKDYDWVTFIQRAIAADGASHVRMYKHVERNGSESYSSTHRVSDVRASYGIPAVSLKSLIAEHSPVLVKVDIESAEYDTLHECLGVKQVCCEFHHRCDSRFTPADTQRMIRLFEAHDYIAAYKSPHDEYLLVQR